MIEINAAILEKDFEEINTKLQKVKGLVDIMQIDICDGKYVPSKTFLSAGCEISAERLKIATKGLQIELDMMIDWQVSITARFEKWLNVLTTLSPKRLVLHHTSITNEHLGMVFYTLDQTVTEFGLGIHLDDTLEDIMARFNTFPFNYVQIMGIKKVGFGEQKQSEKLIPYIQAFHDLAPDVPISIDGGVKLENVKALKDAGATRMTIGSGLFKTDDIQQRVEDLRKELE